MAQLLRFPGYPGHPDVFVNPQYVTGITTRDEYAVGVWVMGSTYPIVVGGEVLAVGARIQQAMAESK
jgi:hypothetical protein